MADISVVIKTTDQASSELAAITKAAHNLGDGLTDAGKKGGGLAGVLGNIGTVASGVFLGGALSQAPALLMNMAKGAADDAASMARLEQAITNAAGSFAPYSARINEAITAGQKLAFSDDETRGALSTLTAQTQDADEALRRLTLAQDFARGANIDLATAAKLLGKVTDENVGVLGRYGIQVDKNATSQDLLNQIDKRFGGQAAAFAESDAGKFARLTDQIDEAKESIGAQLLPTLVQLVDFASTSVVPQITRVTEWFGALDDTGKKAALGFGAAGLVALAFHDQMGSLLSMIPKVIDAFGKKEAAKKSLTLANKGLATSVDVTTTSVKGLEATLGTGLVRLAMVALGDAAAVAATSIAGLAAALALPFKIKDFLQGAEGRSRELQQLATDVDAYNLAIRQGATLTDDFAQGFVRFIGDMKVGGTTFTSTNEAFNRYLQYLDEIGVEHTALQPILTRTKAPAEDAAAALTGMNAALRNTPAPAEDAASALVNAARAADGMVGPLDRGEKGLNAQRHAFDDIVVSVQAAGTYYDGFAAKLDTTRTAADNLTNSLGALGKRQGEISGQISILQSRANVLAEIGKTRALTPAESAEWEQLQAAIKGLSAEAGQNAAQQRALTLEQIKAQQDAQKAQDDAAAAAAAALRGGAINATPPPPERVAGEAGPGPPPPPDVPYELPNDPGTGGNFRRSPGLAAFAAPGEYAASRPGLAAFGGPAAATRDSIYSSPMLDSYFAGVRENGDYLNDDLASLPESIKESVFNAGRKMAKDLGFDLGLYGDSPYAPLTPGRTPQTAPTAPTVNVTINNPVIDTPEREARLKQGILDAVAEATRQGMTTAVRGGVGLLGAV